MKRLSDDLVTQNHSWWRPTTFRVALLCLTLSIGIAVAYTLTCYQPNQSQTINQTTAQQWPAQIKQIPTSLPPADFDNACLSTDESAFKALPVLEKVRIIKDKAKQGEQECFNYLTNGSLGLMYPPFVWYAAKRGDDKILIQLFTDEPDDTYGNHKLSQVMLYFATREDSNYLPELIYQISQYQMMLDDPQSISEKARRSGNLDKMRQVALDYLFDGNYGPEAGALAIYRAAALNDMAALKLLINTPGYETDVDGTPITFALSKACAKKEQKLIDSMVKAMTIKTQTKVMHTIGVLYDRELMPMLITAGVNVNIANGRGETPIMRVSDPNIVGLLVSAGANIHATNHRGKTALQMAKEEHEDMLVKYLMECGAKR